MRLTKREKIISILTLSVVILWVFNVFFYAPKKLALAKTKEELATLKEVMTQSVILHAENEQLEKTLQAMQERLRIFQTKLSRGKNISAFLKGLAAETSRLNIKIISLLPKEEPGEPDPRVKSYSIEVKLISSYQAFTLFLDRLQEMPVLTMVDQFQIEKGEKEPSNVKVNLKLKAFVVKGERT